MSPTASGFLAKVGDYEAEALTEIEALREVVARISQELIEVTSGSREKSPRTSTVQADTERL